MFNYCKLFSIAFLLMLTSTAFSQTSFSHSLGAGIFFISEGGTPAITYSPRINIASIGDEGSFSIGSHIGAGFQLNSRDGGYFTFNLPILAEINLGHAALPDSDSKFGGFAGVGFGINRIGVSDGIDGGIHKATGLVLNGGLRSQIKGKSLSLRLSYILNFKKDYLNVYGLSFGYNLGQ